MSLDNVNSLYKKGQSLFRLQNFGKGEIRWKGSRDPATGFRRLPKVSCKCATRFRQLPKVP